MTVYDLPMPNETYDGKTVVASCWLTDDDEDASAILLLLAPTPPYFFVVSIAWSGGRWTTTTTSGHSNIVHAVDEYAAEGADA